jgi:hypothetical protein
MGTKTISELRKILSEEIDGLRNGNTTPANVNAITNATGKILSSVKLEIEYNKMIGKKPEIDFLDQQKKLPDKKKND